MCITFLHGTEDRLKQELQSLLTLIECCFGLRLAIPKGLSFAFSLELDAEN